MGWKVRRRPLTAEPVAVDWVRNGALHQQMRGARRPRRDDDDLAFGFDSDDSEVDGPLKDEDTALEVPVLASGSPYPDDYAEEPGTTTLFGCRLCSSFVPTSEEAAAFMHVLRVHDKACVPASFDIFAVRCPLPIDDD